MLTNQIEIEKNIIVRTNKAFMGSNGTRLFSDL